MRRITTLAAMLLLTGALAACGDDDDDSLTLQTDSQGNVIPGSGDIADNGEPSPDDIPGIGEGSSGESEGDGSAGGGGSLGTVTVDGVEYGLDEAIRCEESTTDDGTIERLLEVMYTGGEGDGQVRLDLYSTESDLGAGPQLLQSVNWSGPEGRFNGGGTEINGSWLHTADHTPGTGEAPYTRDGDRITGATSMAGDRDPDTTIEISFDVVFPDETTSCR